MGVPSDGTGASDHDEAYRFGQRLTAVWHWPFDDWQFSRLMLLRSQVHDRRLQGDTADEPSET